jgi:EpsI family protein
MQITRQKILAITFGLLFVLSECFVAVRLNPSGVFTKPDLQRLVSLHPDYWKAVPAKYVDPRWNNSISDYYDTVVSQTYQRTDGRQVTVTLTWSRDGIHRGGHFQEICYSAAGFFVSAPEHVVVSTGFGNLDAIAFTATHGNKIEDVVYWRLTGGKTDNNSQKENFITYRFDNLFQILRADIPDNLMVRVSTVRSIDDLPTRAHIEYLKAFFRMLSPVDRKLIMGRLRQ